MSESGLNLPDPGAIAKALVGNSNSLSAEHAHVAALRVFVALLDAAWMQERSSDDPIRAGMARAVQDILKDGYRRYMTEHAEEPT